MKELGYWRFGIQYLHLSQHVAEMIVQNGNKSVLIEKNFANEMFDEKTKWSDHNVALPLFFNFYHGLEVVLKGFLLAKGIDVKTNHKLSGLLANFENEYGRNNLFGLISNYVYQTKLKEPLFSFFENSDASPDQFYQALKYPESTNKKMFEYEELLEKGADCVWFYKTFVDDIKRIRKEAVKLDYTIIDKSKYDK